MRILVTSSKGGIGKTTLSAGLALAFVKRDKRVLLCDCDLGGRCLDMFLGITDEVLFDIGDIAAGRCKASDALLKPWNKDGFYFCPAPAVYSPDELKDGALVRALKELEAACTPDIVICDTAGMVCAPDIAKDFVSTALVVSTQQPASVRAAEAAAILLADKGLKDTRLVISNFEWKAAEKGKRAGIIDIIDGAGMQCAGIVPNDRKLMLAGEAGHPPADRTVGMQAFMNIAARLEGYNVRLFSGMDKISGKKAL